MKPLFKISVYLNKEGEKEISFENYFQPFRAVYISALIKKQDESLTVRFAPEINGKFEVSAVRAFNFLETVGLKSEKVFEVLNSGKKEQADLEEESRFLYFETFKGNEKFERLVALIWNFGTRFQAYKGEKLEVGTFVFRVFKETEKTANGWKQQTRATFHGFEGTGKTELEALEKLVSNLWFYFGGLAVPLTRQAFGLEENGGASFLFEENEVLQLTNKNIYLNGPFLVSAKNYEEIFELKGKNKVSFVDLKNALSYKLLILFSLRGNLSLNSNGPEVLGLWKSGKKIFVDLSAFFSEKAAALYYGKEQNQLAIFEVEKIKSESGAETYEPRVLEI